jgi:arginine deiminase
MMHQKINTRINSEIGELEAVILHKPGLEVENMTPRNAQRALYSDILNLSVAQKEYSQLSCLLAGLTKTYFVEDLLSEVLSISSCKEKLIRKVCQNEGQTGLITHLLATENQALANQLIQGVPIQRNTVTNFLNEDNYSLPPLHNFFFTRDASISIHNKVLIASMANRIRERESFIMQSIFEFHPKFSVKIIDPIDERAINPSFRIEGGDILVARHDILIIGIGARTSTQGVDFILEELKKNKTRQHIIVQELPFEPESFIHLDMVFTLLDKNCCMVYEPLIIAPNRFKTVHISIDNGLVSSISEVENIPAALKNLGMDLELTFCGGKGDSMIQEREQWHSGANFFAFAPGKVIGYNRNTYTLENMNKAGFEILKAKDVNAGKTNPLDYKRCVVSMDGSELARGGGGARCMTMPVSRKEVDWK